MSSSASDDSSPSSSSSASSSSSSSSLLYSSLITRAFAVDLTAGWLAGAASVAVTQPLDTALVRLQASNARTTSSVVKLASRTPWAGSVPMVALVPVQNAMLFAGYGVGARMVDRDAGDDSTAALAILTGGCVGGVAQSFAASPAELVKVRMQLGAGVGAPGNLNLNVNAAAAAAATAAPAARVSIVPTAALQGAMRNPFKGLGATVLRDGLPHGVWFLSYDVAKKQLKEGGASDDASACIGGGIAAAVAWIVGYPADVIKTRVQIARPAGTPSVGVIAAARELLAEANGNVAAAFYRGLGLKLSRAVPASFVGFGVYEWARAKLES
ncbi:transporter [Pycnococcus provasolii]